MSTPSSVLAIQGGAPENTTFHDIEEEWVVDPHTGKELKDGCK